MASPGSSSLVPIKRSTTGSSPSATKRSRLASLPTVLPASTPVFPASPAGIGFNSLPPLPIISKPFGFLKNVDLRTVELNLSDLPVKFGWELVLFKPVVEQPRSDGVFESGLEFGGLGTEFESGLDVSGFEIGAKPVSNMGKAETQPSSVFQDFLGTAFDNLDRVADIDLDEEP